MRQALTNNTKLSEVTVSEIGIQGDGIANDAGQRYFIPYAAPGDRLVIVPGPPRKEGRSAKIAEIITRGENRCDPPCRHFGTCGGCALQHLAGGAVASAKRGFVATALSRRGLDDTTVCETVEVPPGERRRVRFAVRNGRRPAVGFRMPRGRQVVDIAECPAIRPEIADLLGPLKRLVSQLAAVGGDADILVTRSDTGLDLLVRPAKKSDPTLRDRETLAAFADRHDLARIAWDGPGGPEPVAQRRQPRFRFGPATVAPPSGAFLQPSAPGEAAIVEAARRALETASRIADLYAGCGALSFPLSEIAPTHAVEGDPQMVSAIRRAAGGLSVSAEKRDLARDPLTPQELAAFDAVVFDPPRAGAKAQASALAESAVAQIVAVSCNPATLARDLRILVDGGYRIESVLPIDQFPWSPHVEAVAVLRR